MCWWIATNSHDILQVKRCKIQWFIFNNIDYNIDKNDDILMCLCQQMEVLGSVHIFLTPNQRSWMNAIKNAAAKKPKKKVKRPEVI